MGVDVTTVINVTLPLLIRCDNDGQEGEKRGYMV
jgi:hypothetical protein